MIWTMKQNCKNIFLYNKKNELTTYVDLDENGKFYNYYNLSGRDLTKINICTYKEKNKVHTDIKKAKIIFGEDCTLHHMFLDGDSRVAAIKQGSFRLEPPEAISRIYSHNDEDIESFTISQDKIKDWLSKI